MYEGPLARKRTIWLAQRYRILEDAIRPVTGESEVLYGFPHVIQPNAGIVYENMPWPFHSTFYLLRRY